MNRARTAAFTAATSVTSLVLVVAGSQPSAVASDPQVVTTIISGQELQQEASNPQTADKRYDVELYRAPKYKPGQKAITSNFENGTKGTHTYTNFHVTHRSWSWW